MFFLRSMLRPMSAGACGVILLAGCAKSDDGPAQTTSAPATQPAQAQTAAVSPATEPTASTLVIGKTPYLFPPTCLRLSNADGKVVARLYSDDPRGVLTGTATVNSFDMMMALPNITDPADITKTTWIDRSGSMEKQNTPYGIFLNNQQDILQPMNVKIYFQGQAPHIQVIISGMFAQFHISDQNPNPAPTPVPVNGVLEAVVSTAK